jgi:hypothetical protein
MSEKVYEINATTNEIIERDPTPEEIAQELADRERLGKQAEAKAEAEAQKAADKAALLEKLGITESEAKLLLS